MKMTGKSIDLKISYGQTYRSQHDPADSHEPGGRNDPWLYIIPRRQGHIYVHSSSQLALSWESSALLAGRGSAGP